MYCVGCVLVVNEQDRHGSSLWCAAAAAAIIGPNNKFNSGSVDADFLPHGHGTSAWVDVAADGSLVVTEASNLYEHG